MLVVSSDVVGYLAVASSDFSGADVPIAEMSLDPPVGDEGACACTYNRTVPALLLWLCLPIFVLCFLLPPSLVPSAYNAHLPPIHSFSAFVLLPAPPFRFPMLTHL